VYAIVQHSGFGYGGDPTFEQAVEHRKVTANEAAKVLKAGGMVFVDWLAADEMTERINYPEGHAGLEPAAIGTFSDLRIDTLRVYIPVRQVVG